MLLYEKNMFADTSNQSTLGSPPSISDSKNQNTSYGFGSRTDRFSVVHSQPSSPMVEKPLSWFIKDIDIGDGGESKQNPDSEMFGHRPIRRRSRHESHFVSGSHIPVGKTWAKDTFFVHPSFLFHFLVFFIFIFYFLSIFKSGLKIILS